MPGPRSDSDAGPPSWGDWRTLAGLFPQASPQVVAGRALGTRSDTKFLLTPERTVRLLTGLRPWYAVLPSALHASGEYHTLYFDTDQLDLFHAHRRGGRIRHKVRIRHYLDRKVSALEVKTRLNEMRTVKHTRGRQWRDDWLSPDDRNFIAHHSGLAPPVVPQVWTRYRRLTLFGIESEERVTLDLDFQVDMGNQVRRFSRAVLVEVKQARFQRTTPVMAELHALGARSCWASKYCLGVALTQPGVRLAGLGAALRGFAREAA